MTISREEANRLWGTIPVPSDKLKKEFLDLIFSLESGMLTIPGGVVDGVHFNNPIDAIQASTPGSTVYLGTDTYNLNNILVGIDPTANIHTQKGVNFLYNGAGGDPSKAIVDTSVVAGGWKGSISGEGTFINTANDVGAKGVLNLANDLDEVSFKAHLADAEDSRAFWVEDAGAGSAVLSLDVDIITGTNSQPSIYVASGSLHPSIREISNTDLAGVAIEANGGNIFGGTIGLLRGGIVCNSGFIDLGYTTAENHFVQVNNGELDMVGGTAIVSANAGINAMYECNAGILSMHTHAGAQLQAGSGTIPTILHNGGTSKYSGSYANSINNANGHVATVTASGLIILQETTLVAINAGAKSLFSSAPQNVKVYPGAVSNRAKGANITEQVSSILFSALVQ